MPDLIEFKKMFRTADGLDFYSTGHGEWYAKSGEQIIMEFKCIGSLDMERNPAFSRVFSENEEMLGLIIHYLYNELQKGPPEGYVPYYVKGYIPLFTHPEGPEKGIGFGNVIDKVYVKEIV